MYIITLLSPKRNLIIVGKSSQSSNDLWPRLASVSNKRKGKQTQDFGLYFDILVSLVFRVHDCFRDSKSVFCTLYLFSLEKETAFPCPPQKRETINHPAEEKEETDGGDISPHTKKDWNGSSYIPRRIGFQANWCWFFSTSARVGNRGVWHFRSMPRWDSSFFFGGGEEEMDARIPKEWVQQGSEDFL